MLNFWWTYQMRPQLDKVSRKRGQVNKAKLRWKGISIEVSSQIPCRNGSRDWPGPNHWVRTLGWTGIFTSIWSFMSTETRSLIHIPHCTEPPFVESNTPEELGTRWFSRGQGFDMWVTDTRHTDEGYVGNTTSRSKLLNSKSEEKPIIINSFLKILLSYSNQ